MTMQKTPLVLLLILATAFGAQVSMNPAGVDYPANYRSWRHINSMIIQPGHPLEDPFGGIHHIYANSKAFDGLEGSEYETGATFVFDLLSYIEQDKTIVQSKRKRIDVMQYDADRFADTGGWGFDTFVGNSTTERVEQNVVSACFGCHQSAKQSGYVFSKYVQ